jgi:ATP-dependent protease ClpP protease subunit
MPDLSKLTALAEQVRAHATKPRNARPEHGKWWRITNAGGDVASVYLYGVIGGDMWGEGNTAADFANELAAVTAPRLNLHINSEGGQVFEGIAIHSAIAAFPGTVTAKIDGLAASAASFIAMACDRIEMAKPAKMMIHDAATGFAMGTGNAADLRQFAQEVLDTADLLDEMSDTIAEIYATRAGGTVAQWRDVMRAETWYSAQTAVAAGLADGVIGADPETPAAPAGAQADAVYDYAALSATLMEVFRA